MAFTLKRTFFLHQQSICRRRTRHLHYFCLQDFTLIDHILFTTGIYFLDLWRITLFPRCKQNSRFLSSLHESYPSLKDNVNQRFKFNCEGELIIYEVWALKWDPNDFLLSNHCPHEQRLTEMQSGACLTNQA